MLLAEAWQCCELAPNTAEFAELQAGARLFARRPAVAVPIATALIRHGKRAEAMAVLDATESYATDGPARADIARLRADSNGVRR